MEAGAEIILSVAVYFTLFGWEQSKMFQLYCQITLENNNHRRKYCLPGKVVSIP